MQKLHMKELDTQKDKIYKHTGVKIAECYQCGKCSAGCPLIEEMDIPPNQILRMLQLDLPGTEDKILRSYSIWLCLNCETCYTRCPKEVDLPEIMDYLRSESICQGKVNTKAKKIIAFHKTFLAMLKHTGRLYEVGLIGGYKMRTFNLLQDVAVAPKMFAKGKLNLFPHKIKGKNNIKKIFKKTINQRKT